MFAGVPGGIRTHGLSLRRRTLYPSELQRRITLNYYTCFWTANQVEMRPAVVYSDSSAPAPDLERGMAENNAA